MDVREYPLGELNEWTLAEGSREQLVASFR